MTDINIVISTGAGISADSGIHTYRDEGGLWTKYDPQVVSHINGWKRTPQKVLDFKNELRRQFEAGCFKPNAAHYAITRLQKEWKRGKVTVITQNIDGLHEKAGSSVLNMHGTSATKFCENCNYESPFDADIILSDPCPNCGIAGKIRPSVVMFGEMPRHLDEIDDRLRDCDIFVVIGSSLEVSPGNQFVSTVATNKRHAMTMLVNLDRPNYGMMRDYRRFILGKASIEVPKLVAGLLDAQEKPTTDDIMQEFDHLTASGKYATDHDLYDENGLPA